MKSKANRNVWSDQSWGKNRVNRVLSMSRGGDQHRGTDATRMINPDKSFLLKNKFAPLPKQGTRLRPELGVEKICAGCGMTKDFWRENSGEGIHKHGYGYCCKDCASGKGCTCGEKA